MKKQRTYYEVLQVSPLAAPEIISAAYRALMLRMRKHPDRGGDLRTAQDINEAYDTLSDSEKRRRYDALLLRPASEPDNWTSLIERRKAVRRNIDTTVSFCFDHDLKWYPARVSDCSELGLKLRSKEKLSLGQHLVIAPSNLVSCAIHGTVMWVRSYHPSIFERVFEAGVEFMVRVDDIDSRLQV